jgi:hypothetical protein
MSGEIMQDRNALEISTLVGLDETLAQLFQPSFLDHLNEMGTQGTMTVRLGYLIGLNGKIQEPRCGNRWSNGRNKNRDENFRLTTWRLNKHFGG